jgi:hypothetical protein
MTRLGVKLCGNCNPEINSMSAARKIAADIGMQLVPYDEGDITLTVSGCISSCVYEKYPSPVQIQGLMVNGTRCASQKELVERAIEEYRRIIHDCT